MRRKLLRPVVELFERDGSVIDVNMLARNHAFSGSPLWYPLRRLRTFPDRLEKYWPDKNKPPVIILIQRTKLYLGGSRPWFICPRCQRRVGKLYDLRIDILCRKCYDLGYVSQRSRLKKRLAVKIDIIRNKLWSDASGKLIRPHLMFKTTYRKHLNAISRIEHAIRHGLHVSSPRYRRYRERDDEGRYCADELYEQNDLGHET